MKLMVLGFGRSGKDYAAEFLRKEIGLKYYGSSYLAAKIFLFDLLKEEKGYKTFEECFEDRHSPGMRQRWYQEISNFNKEDPLRLCKEIYNRVDCYVGLRRHSELEAAKKFWPNLLCIWIDAEGRVGKESEESCTATKEQADIIIQNNDTLEEFDIKLKKLSYLLEDLV